MKFQDLAESSLTFMSQLNLVNQSTINKGEKHVHKYRKCKTN